MNFLKLVIIITLAYSQSLLPDSFSAVAIEANTWIQPDRGMVFRKFMPRHFDYFKFLPAFNQVNVEAIKFGLIIGKGGETIKKIMMETGWTPKPLRAPLRESKTLKGIRHHLVKTADERKRMLKQTAEQI